MADKKDKDKEKKPQAAKAEKADSPKKEAKKPDKKADAKADAPKAAASPAVPKDYVPRLRKHYDEVIRKELIEKGIALEDTPQGVVWKRKP